MLLYHPESKDPVDAHPTQVEWMKQNGWSDKPPDKPKTKPVTKPAK